MAAEMETDNVRPNIRIEIHNNLIHTAEDMEVDPEEHIKSDNEEGEIIDDSETVQNQIVASSEITERIWTNPKGIFTTGINIFDKAEQEKLQERAKRFALKPDEIRNFTDTDLEELYESLGITDENKNNVRFEAVHILGTGDMSAEDILEFFVKYAPTAIEWVNEDSCNVTWLENISAARALFYVSKPVHGMPAREPSNTFPKEFIDDLEEPEDASGQSILLKNANRIVELEVEKEEVTSKINYKNAVDISEITIPIPPGYWRLGEKHPKAKCLLLRFAFKTDKKPYKTELFSKYYKNIVSSKGIIPESKKKELRGIFDRNRELNQEKNPWGSLAKNWHRDARFCEREPELELEKPIEVKNPSIRGRLGTKKQSLDEDKPEDNTENAEEEEHAEKKKSKIPRMRMYADEEEEKIKRKKLLQTLKKQTEKLSKEEDLNVRDLRNVLGITNNKRFLREERTPPEPVDLGTRLRNRTKNMVFTVEREVIDLDAYDRKENVQSDIRSLIEKRRARSPLHSRRKSPPRWSSEREPAEYRRHRRISHLRRSRSPIRRSRSPVDKKRYGGTLHSDRIEGSKSHRHRNRLRSSDYFEDETGSRKPRSKVAVVIKTQRKPTVASTIWSRVQAPSESESDSDSESSSDSDSSRTEEESSSSEESEGSRSDDSSSSESSVKRVSRPGFKDAHKKLSEKNYKSSLKITMTNDHFRK